MSLTTTETLGFADGVIEFLTNPGAPGLRSKSLRTPPLDLSASLGFDFKDSTASVKVDVELHEEIYLPENHRNGVGSRPRKGQPDRGKTSHRRRHGGWHGVGFASPCSRRAESMAPGGKNFRARRTRTQG